MKKCLLLILSTLFLFSSCGHKNDEPTVDNKANRTVLAYFLTGSLGTSLQNNIVTMFEGMQKTTKASTALIYWDNKAALFSSPCIIKLASDGKGNVNGITATQYAEYLKGSSDKLNFILGKAEVVKSYPTTQNPADKDVITAVLKDMISLSSSKEYGLIFGSHATSWLPSNVKRSRSLGSESDYSPINMPELNEALLNVSKKFQFILMDACMMGNIEVIYELNNTCTYYLGSPMEVPTNGFPYDVAMPYLFSDNTSDYTTKICDAYTTYYTNTRGWGNCIAVDCTQIPSLVDEIKKFVNAYIPADISSVQHYYKDKYSIFDTTRFTGLSYDILDFVNKSNDKTNLTNIKSALARAIVAKSFVLGTYTDAFPSFENVDTSSLCGMGMYIPTATQPAWNSYIKQLLWGEASGWSQYISNNNF